MELTANVAKRRLAAVVVSSVLSSILLLGKALSCHTFTPGSCASPKPGLVTLALVFSLGSWLTVFPLVLLLSRFTFPLVPAIGVPLIAVAVWAFLDTPTVERMGFVFSFSNIARQVLLPWLVGSVVAAYVWPNKRLQPIAREDARSG